MGTRKLPHSSITFMKSDFMCRTFRFVEPKAGLLYIPQHKTASKIQQTPSFLGLAISRFQQPTPLSTTMSLSCLPTELHAQVLAYFQCGDHFRCLRVCKRWSSLIIRSSTPLNGPTSLQLVRYTTPDELIGVHSLFCTRNTFFLFAPNGLFSGIVLPNAEGEGIYDLSVARKSGNVVASDCRLLEDRFFINWPSTTPEDGRKMSKLPDSHYRMYLLGLQGCGGNMLSIPWGTVEEEVEGIRGPREVTVGGFLRWMAFLITGGEMAASVQPKPRGCENEEGLEDENLVWMKLEISYLTIGKGLMRIEEVTIETKTEMK